MIRFRMDPKDDLSSRADFTFDLMQSMSAAAREAIESSEELSELKTKAKVDVTVSGSLNSIDIKITVAAREGATLSEEEISRARAHAFSKVDEVIKSRMSDLIQGAVSSARSRM